MSLGRLLETIEVSITTSAAAVTAPAAMTGKASSLVMGAHSSDTLIKWRRQPASDSSYSKLCPDLDTSLEMSVNPGQTLFYAKTLTGTGTLEVELWE